MVSIISSGYFGITAEATANWISPKGISPSGSKFGALGLRPHWKASRCLRKWRDCQNCIKFSDVEQNWVNFGILSEEATQDVEDMRMYPWNLADGRSLNPPCFRITATLFMNSPEGQTETCRDACAHLLSGYMIWYDVSVCHCMSKMGSKHWLPSRFPTPQLKEVAGGETNQFQPDTSGPSVRGWGTPIGSQS